MVAGVRIPGLHDAFLPHRRDARSPTCANFVPVSV